MGLFSGKRKSDGTFDMRTSGKKRKIINVLEEELHQA